MKNLFRRRLLKEKSCKGKRDKGAPILSTNPKTGFSLNLPVKNCRPTPACTGDCYACQGPIAFPYAIEKSIAIDRWIRTKPKWAAKKAACESKGKRLRLNGAGDMTPKHIPFVETLLEYKVKIFGFTKRPETWRAFSDINILIMFSIDVTMDKKRLDWALNYVPQNRLAYCRRPGDPDWSDYIGVTFPEHGSITNNKDKVPYSKTDCTAIRNHTTCEDCGLCF